MRIMLVRRIGAAILTLALALSLAASSAESPASGVARSGPGVPVADNNVALSRVDESSTSGAAAVAGLGTRLPQVARRYGWSVEKLTQTLLTDSSLHVDSTGSLFFVEPVIDAAALGTAPEAAGAVALAAAPFPLTQTFSLHSLPGAKLTILLDFGPRTMTGNAWTTEKNGGNPIPCPAWSLDADPAFSDAEKTAIQEIWQRVAEDYAPFNVDVTTEFTTEGAITRSSSADLVYGTRVLISPISSYFGATGGIAYINVFDTVGDEYKPALVFPERLGNNTKNIAEAASHECGHNLNLIHDGTSTLGYYPGSGSGETGWAPIMGVGYSQNVTQWSKGEYPGANNPEDDLDTISRFLAYRPDDVGDAYSGAAVMPTATALSASGSINSSSDVDVYRFSAGTGSAVIDVKPAAVGPDLDVFAEIRDSGGNVVASNNGFTALSARVDATLQQGTYYLLVRGTGKGSPLDVGGYSNYASIGQYTVSGTVSPRSNFPIAFSDMSTTAEDATLSVGAPGVLANDDVAGGSISATLVAGPAHGTLALAATGGYTYRPAADYSGPDAFSYRASDGATFSAPATVTITVTPVNDAPDFTAGGDVTVAEDSGAFSAPWASAIGAGAPDESAQALTFSVTGGNAALFSAQPAVARDGRLTFTPKADANGSAVLSVTLTDDASAGGAERTRIRTFTITVTPVNDAPPEQEPPVTITVPPVNDAPPVQVLSFATVSVSTPSRVKRARAFDVTGRLSPAYATSAKVTLRIERYYKRRWRVVKRATVTVPPGASTYRYRAKLSTKGIWRVVATHSGDNVVDGGDASATRGFRVR